MPTVAYLGLDISQADVSVCFLLADGGEPVPRWTVANSQPGADSLSGRIAQLCQTHQVAELRIGLEATGLLWWHLACALIAAPPLRPFQPHLYVLNPQLVATFRRNYGALPKTDRADAFLDRRTCAFRPAVATAVPGGCAVCAVAVLDVLPLSPGPQPGPREKLLPEFSISDLLQLWQVQPFGDPFGATASTVLSNPGAACLTLPILRDLDVVGVVDALAPSRHTVSHGRIVSLLAMNRLQVPQPLYKVESWLERSGLDAALDVQAAQAHDTRLGETLDAVYTQYEVIWQRLVLTAVRRYRLPLTWLHYGITSTYFEGAYSASELIKYGYSRDHRPDTKQLNIGLTTLPDGLPFAFRVLIGDMSTRRPRSEPSSRAATAGRDRNH